MAWTYSGDPAESDRDHVRFLIGDTDSTAPEIQDEEIDAVLVQCSDPYLAAIEITGALEAKYVRKVTMSTGKTRQSFSDVAKAYRALYHRLRSAISTRLTVYAGGLSQAEKDSDAADTDLTQPYFRVGMMKNPDSWDDPTDDSE